MLSLFPSLLAFQMFSPLIIRLTLGGILLYWSYKTIVKSRPQTNQKVVSLIEGISGTLLIIGLWTQVAALIVVIDFVVRLYFKFQKKLLFSDGVNYYFVLLVLAVSLLFSGAGFLAFDLPI